MTGKELSELRLAKNLTQTELSKLSGVPLGTLGRIEANKNEEVKKAKTLDALLVVLGEGYVPKKQNAKDLGRIEYDEENETKFSDLGDGKYLMLVPLVNEFAHAGYLSNFKDSEYLEDLPKHTIIVDKHHRGHYRAFEVIGDSMDNNTRESIIDGSIATGREIKRELWKSKFHTHRSKDFIFVSNSEGIICKRIIGQDVEQGILKLHSLNPDKATYPDFDLHLDDVQQIFSIVQVTQKRYI
jgi:transcriptional regulator with XRE-family HTH domain